MYACGRRWLSASGLRERRHRPESRMDAGVLVKAHQSARKVRLPPRADGAQVTLAPRQADRVVTRSAAQGGVRFVDPPRWTCSAVP